MQDKTVSLSNGIVKNKNIDEFNKSEEKIFINTPIIDNSFISIQYSINTRNGDASKEIREFDYLTLMQNSETNNKEKINPPKDTDPSILGIYFLMENV